MKKILTAILAACLMITAAGGCNSGQTPQDTGSVSTTAENRNLLEVPDFSGLSREQIEMKYPNYNIVYDEQYDSLPEGEMISQSPLPGTKVDKNEKIIVTVSLGEKLVEVDDYTNRSIADAQTLIEKQGLICEIMWDESETITQNCVIRTIPSARTRVEKGSVITCYVSLGSPDQELRVPMLIGKKIEEATKLASENSIGLTITYDNSSDEEPGTVISQSIDANEIVEPNTRIQVVISGENAVTTKETSITVTLMEGNTGEYELKYYIDGTLQEEKTEIKELSLTKNIVWEIKGSDVHTYSIKVTCLATGKSGTLYEMEVDFTRDPPSKNHHNTFNSNIFRELAQ